MRYLNLKNILVILGIVALFSVSSFAEEATRSCAEEIRNMKLYTVNLPGEMLIDQLAISPDSAEVICLATIWSKFLEKYSGGDSRLEVEFPRKDKGKDKELDAKETALILAEWGKMKGKEGIYIKEDYGNKWESRFEITIKKQEFIIYDIRDSKWRKIDWDSGNKLFRQYLKSVNKMAATDDISSPDRSKILSKKHWKTRRPIPFLPDEPEYREDAYLITIRCSDGVEKQVLKARYGTFGRWSVEWSPDGTFVIFLDFDEFLENGNKFYILR